MLAPRTLAMGIGFLRSCRCPSLYRPRRGRLDPFIVRTACALDRVPQIARLLHTAVGGEPEVVPPCATNSTTGRRSRDAASSCASRWKRRAPTVDVARRGKRGVPAMMKFIEG